MLMENITELNWNNTNVSEISETTQLTFQFVSGFFGLFEIYLFVSLIVYELSVCKKSHKAKLLRILEICAVFSAILFAASIQTLVRFGNASTMICFVVSIAKTTVQNIGISFSYAFIWLRQHNLYSSKKFQDLRGKNMKIVAWIALGLIIVNPLLMFGFQFNGVLYIVVDSICIVKSIPFMDQLPFLFISFSYSFIQATLVFLFFYPLHKNQVFKNALRNFTRKFRLQTYLKKNKFPMSERKFRKPLSSVGATYYSVASEKSTETIKRFEGISPHKRLKKWLKLSVICITSDCLTATTIAVFLINFTPGSQIRKMFLWHDASILISNLCITSYFSDWKTMIFPYKIVYLSLKKRLFRFSKS